MKKIYLSLALVASLAPATAGGYLTNTNQHVAFLRNPARNASTSIDALYSNPAGIAFLPNGWHLSLNLQSAYQKRDMQATFPLFALNADGRSSQTGERLFEGRAKAPIIPSVYLAYKKDKWTFGGHIAVAGGGGRAKFEQGLPMFEAPLSMIPAALNRAGIPGLQASSYKYDAALSGEQFIFSATVGTAYKITDNLSVYAGVRASLAKNAYEGYARNVQANLNGTMTPVSSFLANQAAQATAAAAQFTAAGNATAAATYQALATQAKTYSALTADKSVDLSQSGFGIAPILGVNYKLGKLHLAAKYEFRTAITVKNKTEKNDFSAQLPAYNDGVEVANDVPAMLSLGASYSILPTLRLSAGYHHYYDKASNMAGGKESLLDGDTYEWLAGVEYDLNKRLTLSLGAQLTTYGETDGFQTDLAFYNDSYSVGMGLKYQLTDKIDLNAAYFFTDYKDYNKTSQVNGIDLKTTYKRTNQAIGIGIDYRF